MPRTTEQTKSATDSAPASNQRAARARVEALADPIETWPAEGGPADEQVTAEVVPTSGAPSGTALAVAGDTARLLGTAELAEIKHAAHTIAADTDIISRLDGLREQAMTALRDGRPVDAAVVGQVLDQARGWVAIRGLNGGKPA